MANTCDDDRMRRAIAATKTIAEKLGCPEKAVVIHEDEVRRGIDEGSLVAVSLERLEMIADQLPADRSRGET